MITPVVVILV